MSVLWATAAVARGCLGLLDTAEAEAVLGYHEPKMGRLCSAVVAGLGLMGRLSSKHRAAAARYDPIMKLYTKKGDDGTTGLFGGGRVGKDDVRIEAIGAVDELNGLLGHAAGCCRFDELGRTLRLVQNCLFDHGAELATPLQGSGAESAAITPQRINASHVEQLEQIIDELERSLTPLTQFILPGGSELSCRLHHARSVCRRAERRCVALRHREPVGEHMLAFLNRLGDLLFAMARRANQLDGVEDVIWKGQGTPDG